MARWLQDLDALRRHWGHESWTVLGHSFGASLALVYALTFPGRVRSLVYLSGTGIDASWHDEYRRNRMARMTGRDRARFSLLRERRQVLIGAARDRADWEYWALSALTDYGDPDRAPILRAAIEREELPPSEEVNRVLGAEAAVHTRTGESPDTSPRVSASGDSRSAQARSATCWRVGPRAAVKAPSAMSVVPLMNEARSDPSQ